MGLFQCGLWTLLDTQVEEDEEKSWEGIKKKKGVCWERERENTTLNKSKMINPI